MLIITRALSLRYYRLYLMMQGVGVRRASIVTAIWRMKTVFGVILSAPGHFTTTCLGGAQGRLNGVADPTLKTVGIHDATLKIWHRHNRGG